MEYGKDKIDEVVLAPLDLTTHDQGIRAWKGMDWGAMDRLNERVILATRRAKRSR